MLADIARRTGKTLAQIALRWLIQQGIIAAIPRSSNAERIAENLDVFDFALTDDDMSRIGALKRPDGRIANPAGRAPAWDVMQSSARPAARTEQANQCCDDLARTGKRCAPLPRSPGMTDPK